MKRVFLGLFGAMFGIILLIPSFLIGETFRGASAVSSNPAILAIQVTGILILFGFPMLFWVLLPVLKREQRKKEQV